ncbi:MAG: peptidylprolyl isomerase [Proteobacteria bacterium]|nr:peptidylprolyl isomerase [Pseudomonadota bacterium]
MRRRTFVALAAATATLSMETVMTDTAAAQAKLDPENTLYMDLKNGRVVIELFPDIAPKAVARVKELTRQGFYDGTPFHRVIEGFMAQGGDPTGTGTGGSKLPDLPAEFTTKKHFLRGTVGAARTSDPNSANSQFFIMFAPSPHLDGQYTIWGQVVQGMQFVDEIKRGSGPSGMVQNPDRIVKMQVMADVKN